MNNKIVLITGGSRGIGKQLVIECLNKNFTVIYTYKNKKISFLNSKKFRKKIFAIQSDFSDLKNLNPLIKKVKKITNKIDILINNAGDLIARKPFTNSDDKLWIKTININLLFPILLTKKLYKMLINSKNSVVLNISSIASRHGGVPDSIHYGVAKSGLNTFTSALSKLDKRIRSVAIAPSIVNTDFQKKYSNKSRVDKIISQTPLKRIAKTSDVTNLAMFLIDEKASYISGETYFLTGGR